MNERKMEKMNAHTPLPWKVAEPGDLVFVTGTDTICTQDGRRSICDIVGSTHVDAENAALIVAACNSYRVARLTEAGGLGVSWDKMFAAETLHSWFIGGTPDLHKAVEDAIEFARAEGFKAGQEAMRERAAKVVTPNFGSTDFMDEFTFSAKVIRALAIEEPQL